MNYLELHRRKRGLSIPEAAKIIGVSTTTLYHYEHPRKRWSGRKPWREIREAFETWSGTTWEVLMRKVK